MGVSELSRGWGWGTWGLERESLFRIGKGVWGMGLEAGMEARWEWGWRALSFRAVSGGCWRGYASCASCAVPARAEGGVGGGWVETVAGVRLGQLTGRGGIW